MHAFENLLKSLDPIPEKYNISKTLYKILGVSVDF